MGKNIGYYPKGPKNQHKELATGGNLRQCDKRNLDPSGWGKGQKATAGRTNISSGDTGRNSNQRVPASRTSPDPKGPRGHNVPKSTMTPA